MPLRLLAAISGHGFGHLAQSAPVLNRLRAAVPKFEITVRSALPYEVLARRIEGPFTHQHQADDFGMVMHDALRVDVTASAEKYRAWHDDWPRRVAAAAREIERLAPDLVFADVSYLALAAAAAVGVPAVAMCCLNWADIYWHYCHASPEAGAIHSQITDAYNSATVFLSAEPTMPMPSLHNTRSIGPVAMVGCNRRAEIDARYHLDAKEKLVLLVMGGIAYRPPLERWPALPGVRFIVQRDWRVRRGDVLELESLAMPLPDVLASCDLLLTKPGYGSFVEAAAVGIPVAYVSRDDWPEQPYLVEWLQRQGACAEPSRADWAAGRLEPTLRPLLEQGHRPPVLPDGVAQAADVLCQFLGCGEVRNGTLDKIQ